MGGDMKQKTEFCPRLWNMNPKIMIYDLDGTIIDSSHRARHDENGNLDLEHWKANNTKENIFKDDLLPMYKQLEMDYKQGHIIILCTARELGKWDWEYIHSMGIYYDYVKSRKIGETTVDWKLKKRLLNPFFNLKPFKHLEKFFYDDNQLNLGAIQDMGGISINSKEWNDRFF